ncbi:hypothetical protein KIN20_018455 [Parelaphostrongylus tenuis]|uniref:Glu-AdT subunit C n=2 Tax=Parelaphostrongylus tenuis TaxID=148309 RepID=A0AAD5MJI1_PARTN|nr:hypothetical protein KIN20_018455 [Parelaphostrongylus tenuis]
MAVLLRKSIITNLRRISSLSGRVPYRGDAVLITTEPEISHIEDERCASGPEFDQKLISYLESLSLFRFDSEQAVAQLKNAVKKASVLREVDRVDVEMMYTVWEEQDCPLQVDIPEEPLTVKQVLSNAARVQDDYFISPPGNVPLEEAATLDFDLINQWDRIGVPVAPIPKERKVDTS